MRIKNYLQIFHTINMYGQEFIKRNKYFHSGNNPNAMSIFTAILINESF